MPLFWLRRPHVPLLVLLLSVIAFYPVVEGSYPGRWIFNFLTVAGVLLSVYRIRAHRLGVGIMGVTGAIALAAQLVHWTGATDHAGLVSAAAQATFYFAAASLQVRYILRDSRATVDELFSAAVAFLLLAFGWASAYWCVNALVPGSFAVAQPASANSPTWYELFYFSVTTLSTTGFGDIYPVSSAARAVVMLEQLGGVLYVALIISRLAGFAGRSRSAAGD
jgi:hypothetical protein